MEFADLAIVLITKFPAAGKVKTRLSPQLTPLQAAGVHRCFVLHLAGRIRGLQPAEFFVYFDPPEQRDAMQSLLAEFAPFTLVPQCGGDLGRRLAHIAGVVAERYPRMLILGADSPDVPRDHFVRAAQLAAAAQVSINPTEDGGYWCLGLSRGIDFPCLLHGGIEWSTERTAAHTIANAQKLNCSIARGESWDDVDHPEDLSRLLQRLAASDDASDQKLRLEIEAVISG